MVLIEINYAPITGIFLQALFTFINLKVIPPDLVIKIQAFLGITEDSKDESSSTRRLLLTNAENVGYTEDKSMIDNIFSIIVFVFIINIVIIFLAVLYCIKYKLNPS